ncbi:ParC family partition-associated protein [Xanthomonas translucens]|uniref:ParC family partition-associated protein n=1 Tax=Xanthomonas campestris pv. translucens TaxID=343 RepID=UPI00083B2D92|nr:ParC family partition-associated protein [Xanthomonas translucens]
MIAIEPRALQEAAAAHLVRGAEIRPAEDGEGLVVIVDLGEERRVVGLARNRGVRYFQSFDGAAALLLERGISEFVAHTVGWIPRTQPKWVKHRGHNNESLMATAGSI